MNQQTLIEHLNEDLAEETGELRDKGLHVQLENMVLDETGHREEIERIRREWPL